MVIKQKRVKNKLKKSTFAECVITHGMNVQTDGYSHMPQTHTRPLQPQAASSLRSY